MAQLVISRGMDALDRHRITFVKLLQHEARLSLKTAKQYLERCILGEPVVIDVPTITQAEHLVQEATRLEAIAHAGVKQTR